MINLYGQITPEFILKVDDTVKALIHFNPLEVYNRIKINKFKRWQSLSMGELFPTFIPGQCACGCGKYLVGRATRWYEPDHAEFPGSVLKIINGDSAFIRRMMECYLPNECSQCHCQPYLIEKETIKTLFNGHKYTEYWSATGIQVDHIVGIKNGGGGCWLGNYQFICHKCHSVKTVADNQVRNKPNPLPVSKLFN